MRFIPLQQENLIDLRVFLHKVKGDFLATRERTKSNALEDYVTRGRFRMILAMQGDMVAGYAAYDTMYHKSSKIIGIAVLPALRGQGVGSELLQRAIIDLKNRGLKSTVTKTWESNAASIALLKKFGFKKYKTVKDDRINGESTIWFKCKLQ
jgi:ribosomal protein S18 acetylase RimI-like enzyme